MMERINGFIAAPFTPMKRNGELNLPVIEAYCNLIVRNNMDGIFVCGTSGEGYSLTANERKSVTEKWLEVAPEKLKVIVHVGATGIEDSKELAKHASRMGAWGIGAMNPVLFKPPDANGLAEYCKEIADTVPELPFYFYHIPGITGDTYSLVPFLKRVGETVPNFAGIKYTHENLYELNQCMLVDNGIFEMLHGQDETLLLGLTLGVKGGVGGTYNHCFPLYKDIFNAFNAGDVNEAKKLQNRSQDFINILSKYGGNVIAGKRIMKFFGLDCGPNRLPLRSLSNEEELMMKDELESIGFFDFCNK
jgi:N-acetylneuraminate lyase